MCGRFALGVPPEKLKLDFGLDNCADFPLRYNIPPGTEIPVIWQSPEGKRVLRVPIAHQDLLPESKEGRKKGNSNLLTQIGIWICYK